MNTFIEDTIKMEKTVSKNLGEDFLLFSVIRKNDVNDRWDIVVSTESHTEDEVTDEILSYCTKKMSKDSRLKINGVVFLDKDELLVKKFHKETGNILHDDKEIYNRTYDHIRISEAHIITSGSSAAHCIKKAG